MVSFKELGLVNTREMFAKAIKGGYAIPAFNFNNMEQLQAIIKAAAETVKNYALSDDTYELDTALSQINKALTDGGKTAIDLKTLKGGIATKGYAW